MKIEGLNVKEVKDKDRLERMRRRKLKQKGKIGYNER